MQRQEARRERRRRSQLLHRPRDERHHHTEGGDAENADDVQHEDAPSHVSPRWRRAARCDQATIELVRSGIEPCPYGIHTGLGRMLTGSVREPAFLGVDLSTRCPVRGGRSSVFRMKELVFGGRGVLVGDTAADTVVEYAAVLARAATADTIELRALGERGQPLRVYYMLNSTVAIMAQSSSSSAPEPDNVEIVHYMRDAMKRLDPDPLEYGWPSVDPFD